MIAKEGMLDKKSGSHGKRTLVASWDKRYFVLPQGATVLRYYTHQADFGKGKPPHSTLDFAGAAVSLDEGKLFTVKTKERELHLKDGATKVCARRTWAVVAF